MDSCRWPPPHVAPHTVAERSLVRIGLGELGVFASESQDPLPSPRPRWWTDGVADYLLKRPPSSNAPLLFTDETLLLTRPDRPLDTVALWRSDATPDCDATGDQDGRGRI